MSFERAITKPSSLPRLHSPAARWTSGSPAPVLSPRRPNATTRVSSPYRGTPSRSTPVRRRCRGSWPSSASASSSPSGRASASSTRPMSWRRSTLRGSGAKRLPGRLLRSRPRRTGRSCRARRDPTRGPSCARARGPDLSLRGPEEEEILPIRRQAGRAEGRAVPRVRHGKELPERLCRSGDCCRDGKEKDGQAEQLLHRTPPGSCRYSINSEDCNPLQNQRRPPPDRLRHRRLRVGARPLRR